MRVHAAESHYVGPSDRNADNESSEKAPGYTGMNRSFSMVFNLDDHLDEAHDDLRKNRPLQRNLLMYILLSSLGSAALLLPSLIYGKSWLTEDDSLREAALGHILMILPAGIALMWCVSHVTAGVSAVDKQSKGGLVVRTAFGLQAGLCAFGIVAVVQLRKATVALVPTKAVIVTEYLWIFQGLATVVSFCTLLEMLHAVLIKLAKARKEAVASSKPISKWKGLMQNFCTWRKPEADAVYTFAAPQNAFDVLHQIVWIYFALAKVGAFALFFLFCIGVNIYSNIVWITIGSLSSTLVFSLNLSPAVQNLVPIVLTNAFYLGEIISLTTPGGAPPDNPGKSLTGFVEAVTLTHVVLRDFRRKQTWITHGNFTKYNLSNWTRRPCRLIHVQFTVSSTVSDAKKVQRLADFCKKWMERHEKVDPTSYRKAVVVDVKNGMKVESIFYPLPGVDSYPLRQAFIVALVDAAKRLGLPVVPNEMITAYPDGGNQTTGLTEPEMDMQLEDLLD